MREDEYPGSTWESPRTPEEREIKQYIQRKDAPRPWEAFPRVAPRNGEWAAICAPCYDRHPLAYAPVFEPYQPIIHDRCDLCGRELRGIAARVSK